MEPNYHFQFAMRNIWTDEHSYEGKKNGCIEFPLLVGNNFLLFTLINGNCLY